MPTASSMSWMTAQLLALEPQQEKQLHNLFPAGAERGSTTYRVHVALLCAYPDSMTCHDLIRSCAAGRGAIAWAVCYLAKRRAISKTRITGHAKNMRYRARIIL